MERNVNVHNTNIAVRHAAQMSKDGCMTLITVGGKLEGSKFKGLMVLGAEELSPEDIQNLLKDLLENFKKKDVQRRIITE